MLRLHDTRSGQAEQVEPARRGQLRVFCCGAPAHSPAHLSDLRTALLTDLIRRAAHRRRLSVLACQAVNDVGPAAGPDPLIDAEAWQADCSALNIRPPDYSPRASESIGLITDMIAGLISGGQAYVTADGSVYFDARQLSGHGELVGQRPGDLPPSAGPDPRRSGADWLLWQGVPGDGELTWGAPWGRGFPAPPIACSAMSRHDLGDVIDIHVGGAGLGDAHRESERAQSNSAAGHEVVRHWVDGAQVLFDGREGAGPADSAGPARASSAPGLADLTERGLDPLALRLAFLEHRYRQGLRLAWAQLADADRELRRWRGLVASGATHPSRPMSAGHVTEMADAFEDDLDTPAAIGVLRALASSADVPPGSKFETFAHVDQLLGLDLAREIGRAP